MQHKHPIDIYTEISAKHPEWLEWEPETLEATLGKISDKLLAVQTVARNPNAVTRKSFIFEKVVMAFCNGYPIMDAYTKPYVEELFYAVKQITDIIAASQEISPSEIEFSGDVPSYVGAVAFRRGWVVLPKRLAWAQETLDSLSGVSKGSKRYKEHKTTLEALRKAVSDFSEDVTFEELQAHDSLDGFEGHILSKYIGAFLYDPTTTE